MPAPRPHGEPLKVVSERLGHASTSITANAVANLILGNRKEDEESAVNPLSTGPGVHEAQEGGEAPNRSSVGVSEGRTQPKAYTVSRPRWRCSGALRRDHGLFPGKLAGASDCSSVGTRDCGRYPAAVPARRS